MAAAALDLGSINVIFELEKLKYNYTPAGADEIKLSCPFHDDATPSAFLNVQKKVFICKSAVCGKKGDVVTLLAGIAKIARPLMIEDLKTRYDLGFNSRILNPETVEQYHVNISNAGPFLRELRERGITDEMIRIGRLGFNANRITIPVYDKFGNIINIRRYFPNAPEGEAKFKNTRGYGQVTLYQIDQIEKYDTIWICGGELKALAGAYYLNPHKIGCVSSTGGEGSWQTIWNPLFSNKKIYICMDIDVAGIEASKKIARVLIASNIEGVTEETIRIISLPLDKDKYPKGDLSNYIAINVNKEQALLELMGEKYSARYEIEQEDELFFQEETPVSLVKTTSPEYVNKRIGFDAIVTAISDTPYLIPTEIAVSCDRAQSFCASCPIYLEKQDEDSGSVLKNIPVTSSAIIEMIECSSANYIKIFKRAFRIPLCKSVEFNPVGHTKIQDIRLTPQLTIGGLNKGENVVLNAFVEFQIEPELNQPCHFSGTVHPDPKSGRATLLLDRVSLTRDSLDTFDLTEELKEYLKIFQPKEWTLQSLTDRMNDIYTSIESNITSIYGRRDMLCVYDLAYHSPLTIIFDGKQIPGWINALILGDSAQGKTETAIQLIEAYGLGEKIDCRNASTAGLIGGLQQLSGRWFITWGVIPLHDRRLLILEEAKGLSVEIFGSMTEVRSSGIAQIPKIERRKALARTRLIFLSNPRSGRQLGTYSFGVEAVVELIGSAEDVRRFDIVSTVANGEIDIDYVQYRKSETGKNEIVFSKDILTSLILFAWTIDNSEIEFDQLAINCVYECSKKLTSEYHESFPLIDKGTIRFKLARLSTALAIRSFSYENDKIIVRECHVLFIYNLLNSLYSSPSMGYKEFSTAKKRGEVMKEPEALRKFILSQKYPKDLVSNLLLTDFINQNDMMDWLSIDSDTAQKIISTLVRKQAIKRVNRYGYVKTAPFIAFLRENENRFPLETDPTAGGSEM